MRGYEDPSEDGFVELSSVDESECYEVDIAEIWYRSVDGRFLLRTASGCSCWDGEYDREEFPTFEELKRHLLGDNDSRYNPSLSGAIQILDEAEAKI